ncbi:hypothetical protein FE257_006490 [Aspergillus nanangensis]|uniref:Uncharacterized protein n=1 Tax=Aspergillus nanangensis TaxID=2582783 RepID=A0AAD4CZI8_ASPNN|nr:hypothetical protein FE257_006490 [Aspergillus nanangensis]
MESTSPQDDLASPPYTRPVVIPLKRASRRTAAPTTLGSKYPRDQRKAHTTNRRSSSTASKDRSVPTSIASILEATTIPVPRRHLSVRESRKLPRGNHVQEFSKLMMDGVKSRDGDLMEGTGNTALDLLLSPPEENDRSIIGSDCGSEALSFSVRSMSIDSTPSLDPDSESPSSFPVPSTPSSQRSPSERRYRRPSHSENCAFDHPLLDTRSPEATWEPTFRPSPLTHPTPSKSPSPSRSFPRLGSSFKSNLTASLRAIKSAAQSVSTFATPSVQPDDFLTRSLFTITPEMTDDRRPAPMKEPPSPALRRYLNPVSASPAELYAYHEYPHESVDPHNCPVSVQMQTYNRSRKHGTRKSSFHLAGSEGRDRNLLPFDPEIPPMTRQREPRENSDFLRMIVLEMNMRRSGKLRDDIPTRARVWLPPRKGSQNRITSYDFEDDDEESAVPSRWVGISMECA